jgi:hypothetical protein
VQKVKRIVERPWGRRRNGGWIIQRSQLIEALKKGKAVELDKVVVGANQLQSLLRLLSYEDCLIRANGRLEVETVKRVIRSNNGTRKTGFQRPRSGYQFMSIVNGAWLPKGVTRVVVLKPRKF